jgi:hypothetical protein
VSRDTDVAGAVLEPVAQNGLGAGRSLRSVANSNVGAPL